MPFFWLSSLLFPHRLDFSHVGTIYGGKNQNYEGHRRNSSTEKKFFHDIGKSEKFLGKTKKSKIHVKPKKFHTTQHHQFSFKIFFFSSSNNNTLKNNITLSLFFYHVKKAITTHTPSPHTTFFFCFFSCLLFLFLGFRGHFLHMNSQHHHQQNSKQINKTHHKT